MDSPKMRYLDIFSPPYLFWAEGIETFNPLVCYEYVHCVRLSQEKKCTMCAFRVFSDQSIVFYDKKGWFQAYNGLGVIRLQ